MTHASSAPLGNMPTPAPRDPLTALVRLLAREAARADFATRCNSQAGETSND